MLVATRRAFTLLELLIVVGVIAILIGLALAVGSAVSGTGKEVKTQELLKVLDNSVSEVVASSGGLTPPTVVDPRRVPPNNNGTYVQPVADAYIPGGKNGLINSMGLYMVQCETQPSAAAIFKSLDAKFMRELDQDGNGNNWDQFPPMRTVFDGWDRPIRYVHPAWDGVLQTGSGNPGSPIQADLIVPPPPGKQYFSPTLQIHRFHKTTSPGTDPTADGGICRGGQPYFYSAGPDGKVGYLVDNSGKVLEDYNKDNVYTTKPEFEKN